MNLDMTPIEQRFPPLTKQISILFERQGITTALQEEFVFKEFGEIVIVSDYKEEDTDYFTYAFLCTTKSLLHVWHDHIKDLRENFGLGKRQMAYKKLKNDRIRLQALPKWLSLINRLGGHLIVVSVDKKLSSVFATDLKELDEYMKVQGFTMWRNSKVKERALRITHLVSYLMSLCTRDGQNFYWITDRDPIVDNLDQREGLRQLFERVYPIYLNRSLGKIQFLVPIPEILDERLKLFVEDVLSIPDLVCGAISEGLSAFYQGKNKFLKEAAMLIYDFLNDHSGNLHKHLIHITAEQIESNIGIGGQLYTISLNSVNFEKKHQSGQIDMQGKLLHLANSNSIQASTLYRKALASGIANPVIFILDLRDEVAKNIAMKVITAEHIQKYLKYGQYRQSIPTLVLPLPQRIGVEVCQALNPEGSKYLADSPKPGCFHIVVISDGRCLVGGLPID